MTLRSIITIPDPLLREVSAPVERVDDELRTLMDDMLETMYEAPGIGLAGIQVAVPRRVVVIDTAREEEEPNPLFMVNPEIVELSDQTRVHEEGCLSIPGYGGAPARPGRVEVKGLDLDGNEQTYEGTELLARAFCHEIDHIDGLLFVDRLSPLRRDLLKRRLRKKVKSEGWDD